MILRCLVLNFSTPSRTFRTAVVPRLFAPCLQLLNSARWHIYQVSIKTVFLAYTSYWCIILKPLIALPPIFRLIAQNYSKWSSSSSTPRPSTVTAASRPRRRRTSSSAPLRPSRSRLEIRKLRRTLPFVHLLARTWDTSHQGHRLCGLVVAGGCLDACFAVGLACVRGFSFCPSTAVVWERRRRLHAGGSLRARV